MVEYWVIGIPTIAIIFLDFSCFNIMTLMSGYLGVTEQASQIILFNILALMY